MKFISKNEKLTFTIFLSMAIVMVPITYGLTLGLDYLERLGLRTVAECNALTGTMKDDPITDAEFLKNHPDRANDLQKDNCLEGLDSYNHRFAIVQIGMVILVPSLTFFVSFMQFRPFFVKGETKHV